MAREIGFWKKSGTYITPAITGGTDILVRGANKYINFDSDTGDSGYGIRDNAGTIEIKSFGGSWAAVATGGGESNTASNLGGGEGLYASKIGVALNFKSLVAGTGISLGSDGNEVTITNTGGAGSGEANTITNVGAGGVGLYKTKVGVDLKLKNINAGSADITITDDTVNDEVDIDLSAGVKTSLGKADTATQPADIADFETTTQLNTRDTNNRNTDNHTSGTTNKVYTATEQTKLAGIETAADVTDTTNVTAAGALMDSEVTDLAGIKALNTSTLQVKPAEGAFVDGDKTKLDGIETAADVTDATNVSAAGAPIISSGAGAPASTPSKVGDIYVDTTNDDAYIAVGTASSADWEKSNDGAGGGSPAGSSTYIQYNNAGAFGAAEQTNDGVRWMEDTGDYTFLVGKSSGSNAKMEVNNADAASTRGNLRIISTSDAGGDYDIRIDSPDPDIEFINTDQASPAGDFEIGVPSGSDFFGISGRNAGNTSFETAFQVHRKASGAMVGINVNYSTPEAMLEIVPSGALDLIHLSNAVATSGDIMSIDQSGNFFTAGQMEGALFKGLNNDFPVKDPNGNDIVHFIGGVASAVNYGMITHSATGNDVEIGAFGSDTNVSLDLTTKGSGIVKANGVNIPTVSSSDTLTNKTLTTPAIASIKGTLTTDTDGATITFDKNVSDFHNVVMAGNRILALSNMATGDRIVLRLTQDATGSRIPTWFTTIKWAGGTAPTLTTTANKADMFGFICTSSGNYDGFVIGQNI